MRFMKTYVYYHTRKEQLILAVISKNVVKHQMLIVLGKKFRDSNFVNKSRKCEQIKLFSQEIIESFEYINGILYYTRRGEQIAEFPHSI